MQNNKTKVELSARHRIEQIDIPTGVKVISLVVSRAKCKDVLLELIDNRGNAKGKPLEKCLPQIKQQGVHVLRFMMNDFSIQPIDIEVSWK
ncbi:hypothetical protein [Carboxylicivirga marina]|uniref:Uncharacterized protein n=1 Tax=Carboxylicivirga marina TaxID=2800988 RepID=A0ABS1HNZ4_9BACT|nr:hypothetical protein [Carboxylicivirga marina]MBK3519180.1 hypothetical protein [Carboxylicivirga marina]